MKTTIDIPENELKQAMQYTGARTKRAAIVFALKDFNKRQRLAKISEMLGTFEDFMTPDELKIMREEDKWDKMK